ncbi:MAG: HDIG domain-containing protein [Planctomycetes bacterium]|nr:HDIG domain-containing protein [Planctomycetota bacterium]
MLWLRKQEPRLENWDGRRRSTRDGVSVFPCIWNKFVLARLTLVFLTTAILTFILNLNSPPFPYRLGSVLSYNYRARLAFDVPNQAFAAKHGEPTESDFPDDGSSTPGVSPPVDRYAADSILVHRWQRIDGPKLVLLMAEHRAYAASLNYGDHLARLLSFSLIVSLLAILLSVYVSRFQPTLAGSLLSITGVCLLVILGVGLALMLGRPPWDAAIIPLTVVAMVLAIVYNPPFALLLSFCMSIVMSIGQGTGLGMMLIHSGGLATAVLLMKEVRSRTRPVQVSVLAGAAFLILTVATGMLDDQPMRLFLIDGLRYFLWSLLAGFILSGSLPWIERCFGIMTDATLLELADGSHPLMQELVRRAPGTYTHSMTVATLAESAAERVGANPLLVRVGSYFHDIGKMLKPHYFVENQSGENRHDHLEPALSTLVIMGHVKDGVALARQYRLPKPILDFITQHHGTTLVEYFYREARRIQKEIGQSDSEFEYAFRYPGPKPQTREAGIIMLADAAESASRSMNGPTPNGLRKLVHELLMKRLLDSQFDECGLTLADLKQVEESLAKSLIAVFHARIKYQEPRREVS